jgi:hypothetical protein
MNKTMSHYIHPNDKLKEEYSAQLEERFRLLDIVDKQIKIAKNEVMKKALNSEKADIYHDIGFYTVELKNLEQTEEGLSEVSIKLKLSDGWKNEYYLFVESDSFKILKYTLCGKNGTRNALSNLQHKTEFPQSLDNYTNVSHLVDDIKKVIKTSVIYFKETLYAKSI